METINRTEINSIVKQISTVIKTELKTGKCFDEIMTGEHIQRILNDSSCKDSSPSGFGDKTYDQYIITLREYDGRVNRTHMKESGIEIDDIGCKKIVIKDAILDVILDYGNKNEIKIHLSIAIDWQDKYKSWHEGEVSLKTWTVLDSMYDDCYIEEKFIEDKAFYKNFDGRLVMLNPSYFKEQYREPKHMIVRVNGGFGCSPTATGKAVYCKSPLGGVGGESFRVDRNDVQFIIKEDCEQEVINEYSTKEEVK